MDDQGLKQPRGSLSGRTRALNQRCFCRRRCSQRRPGEDTEPVTQEQADDQDGEGAFQQRIEDVEGLLHQAGCHQGHEQRPKQNPDLEEAQPPEYFFRNALGIPRLAQRCLCPVPVKNQKGPAEDSGDEADEDEQGTRLLCRMCGLYRKISDAELYDYRIAGNRQRVDRWPNILEACGSLRLLERSAQRGEERVWRKRS